MLKILIAFIGLCVVTGAGGMLHAQENTGSIKGTVIDKSTGEPLTGANVLVMGTTNGAAADANGHVSIPGLAPGTYRLRVSMVGYAPRIVTDVVVATGRQAEVRVALEAAAIGLDEVVVQADYFSSNTDAPVSVQSLSYEEIRRAPGGLEDVVRAIAVLPGVAQPLSGRNDLIVRGGAPSENLYIIENIEVPNINHFGTQGATGGPISFVDVDFVREVTFSTGGFGARYGDKLSSVMKIDLKEGRSDRLGGKATISASQFGLNVQGPIGGKGSFLFSARRSYLDFIFKAANFAFVPDYWDFLGKAVYEFDKSNTLSIFMLGALDDVNFFSDTEDQRYDNSTVLGNAQNQYFTGISWRHLVRNGYMVFTLGRTYVNYDYLQSDSLLTPIFKSASKEGETSLRMDGVYLVRDGMEYSYGLQARYIKMDGDYLFTDGGTVPFSVPDIRSNLWDTSAMMYSAYSQMAMDIMPRLRFTAGVRADYFDMIDAPFVVSPRAALRYDFGANTAVTISGGRYRQHPSYIWLVSNPENTALNHLTADQAVLGIERLLREDLRVRVEGYVKRYSDYPASMENLYLVLANTGAGYGGSNDNYASFGFDPLVSDGKGSARGVELLVQKRLSEIPFYGILSVSYNQTDFTALDGIEHPGSYDQRVILNLSGGWKIDENWEVAMKFRFGTGMPYTPFNEDGTRNYTQYNSERLPSVHALDVRVDRRWNFSDWNLITFIDVQNIYNRKNIQGYTWDYRNMRPDEVGTTIGILPSIGISAEF